MYEIKKNEQFNSNEVYFDGIPAAKTREVLYKSVKDGMRSILLYVNKPQYTRFA